MKTGPGQEKSGFKPKREVNKAWSSHFREKGCKEVFRATLRPRARAETYARAHTNVTSRSLRTLAHSVEEKSGAQPLLTNDRSSIGA